MHVVQQYARAEGIFKATKGDGRSGRRARHPPVCRHHYAPLMAAAGVQLHALSRFMGRSSIAVTFDNYGHLFPGEEAASATLQDAFLKSSDARALVEDQVLRPARS